MKDGELEGWFEENKRVLETAYQAGKMPWQQSGFGLHTPRSAEDWEALRRPIADCIERSGTFLDIGCANGYLLECILRWTEEYGLKMIPYGLDFSEKMIELARVRLPGYAKQLFVGNAWNWLPPLAFDYVNTMLDYVPSELHKGFVDGLLEWYIRPGGYLIVAEYLGKSAKSLPSGLSVERYLTRLGFRIDSARMVAIDEFAGTRIAVIKK
jgi:SAM-dependent methyltransferase